MAYGDACRDWLVSIQKWLFSAISVSDSDFNPRNTECIPVVKILIFLDLAKTISFQDGDCSFRCTWGLTRRHDPEDRGRKIFLFKMR
jgi:hypothetical protein